MKQSIKLVRKIGVLLLGVPVLILGIALLVLPGPGLLVIIIGLIILSLEFEVAKRYRDKAKARFKKVLVNSKQKKKD